MKRPRSGRSAAFGARSYQLLVAADGVGVPGGGTAAAAGGVGGGDDGTCCQPTGHWVT